MQVQAPQNSGMVPPTPSVTGTPPSLGTPVPGTTGGLPAQSGLSVLASPLAQRFQSMGRNGDSMMVHMNPEEVKGLQALALAHGTSMTINPVTGMPEAFKLGKLFKKLLPTLAGIGLNFVPGVGPLLAAGLTAATSTALTGSLKKGLLAGLQAYGGASLSGAFAPQATGTIAKTAAASALPSTTPSVLTTPLSETALGASAGLTPTSSTLAAQFAGNAAVPSMNAATGAVNLGSGALSTAGTSMVPSMTGELVRQVAPSALASSATNTVPLGFLDKFAAASREGLPPVLSKYAPYAAGLGVISPFMSSGRKDPVTGAIDNSYQGPYTAQDRVAVNDPDGPLSSRQRRHFEVSIPEIYNMQGQVVQPGTNTAPGTPILQAVLNPNAKKGQNMYSFVEQPYMGSQYSPQQMQQISLQEAISRGFLPRSAFGFAKGGEVPMDDGSFVLDARTVSEIGNGSSNAGMEALSRIGGRPVRGPGDGVSDDVPARIGAKQKARVARDEVIIPAEAVKRIGKGNAKRGADKLYALMDKAHKARKKADRGQDTNLRRGLA